MNDNNTVQGKDEIRMGAHETHCETRLINPIMQYFQFDHLPDHLKEVSKPFCDIAIWVHDELPHNAEQSVALRKLLEAKDAAVRSSLTGMDYTL